MSIPNHIVATELIQAIPASQPLYADDLMVCILIVCGLILAAVMSDRKHFLARLLKSFFLPREIIVEHVRTTNVSYMRMGMYLVAFSSVGLLLTANLSSNSLPIESTGLIWLLATTATLLFHYLRVLLFVMTDRIFLDKATQVSWERNYSNWTLLSSIPLYFSAIIAIFSDLAPHAILWLLGACVALIEICLLYKAFCIFSGRKHGILQLFLYLCTLELIPLLVAAKVLVLFV